MKKAKSKFLFVADDPCLDFLNTQLIQRGKLVDRLEVFPDLVEWLVESGLLEPGFRTGSIRRWGNREKNHTLHQAKNFREALRKMVSRITKGEPVPEPTIEEINRFLRLRKGQERLIRRSSGFVRVFVSHRDKPLDLLAPVAEAAANLLCNADLSLIRKCENRACILYFYDTTKNHARRWCSMKACGNRNKVAAWYRRRRRA